MIKELNPALVDLSKSWFNKESLEDIEAYKNSHERSFQFASPFERWDPG